MAKESSEFRRNYFITGAVLVFILTASVFAGRHFFISAGPTAFAADANVKGAPGASVVIVEYSDFQCPACAAAQQPLRELMNRYEGDVRLVFRHFPLSGHQWSGLAHQAAQCAAEQDRFWPYHDKLFATQTLWSTPRNPGERFIRYARELGLDLDRFASCLGDESVRQKVLDEKAEGMKRQVRSTPSFFIEGELIVGRNELQKQGPELIEKALKGGRS